MSAEDLTKALKELRDELGNLSFKHRIRPLEDTSKLKKIRKDIARISTIEKQSAR
ncbi:MAG: 50S ribosomal protein L29 [Desulforhopalus sp.]|nr:50S ribosomal protein L29 [Desulforhopalus sp.]